jgi:hypothetical protein
MQAEQWALLTLPCNATPAPPIRPAVHKVQALTPAPLYFPSGHSLQLTEFVIFVLN